MTTLAQLLADQTLDVMIAGLAFLLAAFPALYIVEAIGRDRPGGQWPQPVTPTDLDQPPTMQLRAAAYVPDGHHRVRWEADERNERALRWATDELFWIKAVEAVAA